MHPNYWQITVLLVVDLFSSLAYFMMTQPLPIASKLPIKTLVAKQLPTNIHVSVPVRESYNISCIVLHRSPILSKPLTVAEVWLLFTVVRENIYLSHRLQQIYV